MSWKTLVIAAVGLAIIAHTFAVPARTENQNAVSIEEADFTGKVLAVLVKPPVNGYAIHNVRVKRLAGRLFLVGQPVKLSDEDEPTDVTYWVPIEDIQLIREFKNIEDARKGFKAVNKGVK